MTRVLRCAACTKRIRDSHPHIGLLDLQTGEELASYHARGGCQERAREALEGGDVESIGTSGFETREDTLLAIASLGTEKRVKGARI